MGAKLGIDVGGTFTDAVLITDNKLAAKTKVPTHRDDLLSTILSAVDSLGISFKVPLDEVIVSTTLVTNAILQDQLPPVEVFLLPGKGMKLDALPWPVPYHILSGEIDYRGREVVPPNQLEWHRLLHKVVENGNPELVAVIGKFSHRNNLHETQLASVIEQILPNASVTLGCSWGQANFYRRSLTTYLGSATNNLFQTFAQSLKLALRQRGCTAPVFVLKADGGKIPIDKIRAIESMCSGPAASVLGSLAQSDSSESYAVVDIGGTTTDIGVVLSGEPLLSSKGASIGPFLTQVRSLAVRSVPVGGDTAIIANTDGIGLSNYRLGSAYCLGGPVPTVTDAMRYLNLVGYGSFGRAEEGLASLLPREQRDTYSLRRLAESVVNSTVERIAEEIEAMQKEWRTEPAYKIWEVLHPQAVQKFHLWASGGAAEGISSALADRLHTKARSGSHPEVSNAIGAALAKPTFSCTLHLDTSLRRYRIEETGEQGIWQGMRRPYREVEDFLAEIAVTQAQEYDADPTSLQKGTFDFFPIINDYETVGQIIRGAVHMLPGVMGRVEG